ncbi:CBM35 domain-containing protein [Microbulbifer taiwanensis]|uniref:CBM35 domain-containing protein n=1 Tax=Microbulbifer taiwanensis TaxID=986746 RepID=UPI00361A7EB0
MRDGDLQSYWQPGSSSGERISVKDFGGSLNTVIIREIGSAVQNWRLVNHDNGQELASGNGIGSAMQIHIGDQNMDKINLMIDSASSAPQIAEFEIYNATGGGSSSGGSSSGGSSSSSSSGGSSGGGSATITIEENASGFCNVDGAVESEHAGYTGSGYANTDNASGEGVDWAVSAPSAGVYTLLWRFANGTSDRPANVLVNGGQVASINMDGTGAWTSYVDSGSVEVGLNAGSNQLRLQATGSGGLANIDHLEVTGSSPQAGSCN